jgi:CDGSH-type Zn-finger protein/uncharacterized Fe-S cluster protein YjdI
LIDEESELQIMEKNGGLKSEKADIETVEGWDLFLHFEAKKCIHARHCVLGAPAVFKANTQGEWLLPNLMATEQLISVAHLCPSGAITFTRKDGGTDEQPPQVNTIRLREDGPYAFSASLTTDGKKMGNRATLCRCGASKNKPFCDNSHKDVQFRATGEPETKTSDPLSERSGPLKISEIENGPLVITGNVEICSGTGRTVDRASSAALCRCGGSSTKPFCDGTHASISFKTP